MFKCQLNAGERNTFDPAIESHMGHRAAKARARWITGKGNKAAPPIPVTSTSTLNFRHPGERRDPGFQRVPVPKVWAPTFVGMTEDGFAFVGREGEGQVNYWEGE